MTDFEAFKGMLERSNTKFDVGYYGDNMSLVFNIDAGIAGSRTTLGEAFFVRATGVFLGIHHCD